MSVASVRRAVRAALVEVDGYQPNMPRIRAALEAVLRHLPPAPPSRARCSRCGRSVADWSCGPTHAARQLELSRGRRR